MSRDSIILASSSPRRQELLRTLGLPVRVVPSDADESVAPDWSPVEIVERLSFRKAKAVCDNLRGAQQGVVLGSDTIVVLEHKVLGKPKDDGEAASMLRELQGRDHQVFTGVALLDAAAGPHADDRYAAAGAPRGKAGEHGAAVQLGSVGRFRVLSSTPDGRPEAVAGHTVSKVTFRPMSDGEIRAYVKTGDPLDKAGAYGIQGVGSVFVEKIEGDFYSVMGLPLNLLYRMLLLFGIGLFPADSEGG